MSLPDDASLRQSISILEAGIRLNPILQYVAGVSSLFLCVALFYIILKWTPEELKARRLSLLNQLVGCGIHSLVYMASQPIPLFPYRVVIFTGPVRSAGSLCTAILWVLWGGNMVFLSVSALCGAFSHYLDITHGIKQVNRVFEWYRSQSLIVRFLTFVVIQVLLISIKATTLFFAIDYEFAPPPKSAAEKMKSTFATIHLEDPSHTLQYLAAFFVCLMVFYVSINLYTTRAIVAQLEEIRSSISPKTFRVMHRMARLLAAVVMIPIIFYFLPGAIFTACNFFSISFDEQPVLLWILTATTEVLFTLYPTAIYAIILICFKQYRHALGKMLCLHRALCGSGRFVSIGPSNSGSGYNATHDNNMK